VFLGSVAGILGLSTLILVGQYSIEFLDAIVFIEVAIILMLEALETGQQTARQLTAKLSVLGQV
jgi:hypothetical protein